MRKSISWWLGSVIGLALVAGPGLAAAQEARSALLRSTTTGTPVLTLDQAWEIARESNPRLAAARAMASAIGTRAASASLPPDPAFQIGVMNFSVPGLRTDMPNSMAPAVQVMQMMPFPGKLGLAGRMADQSTAVGQSDAAEAWWQVRSEVAAVFYEMYRVEQSITVLEATRDLLVDFADIALSRYATGSGPQSDVLRANVEVARMVVEIRRMTAMREAAAIRLNGIADRPSDTSVPTAILGDLPADLPPADTLFAWATSSRPLLASGRTAVERAATGRELARREIWPDLNLGVQYGQRAGSGDTDRMASLMLGFSVPIFASRRQYRMRDEASALEAMARAELSEMHARVRTDIARTLADLERDRSLVSLYRRDILPQANANVESAMSSYRAGTVDFMTLLDARMTANRYEIELLELIAGYGTLIADLETAIGRELPRSGSSLAEGQ